VAVFQALPVGLERFFRLTALSLVHLEQPNDTRDALLDEKSVPAVVQTKPQHALACKDYRQVFKY